jgi:hypothetical protein
MSASNIRAGRAFVEILANNKPLQAGLKRAQAMLRGFGAVVNQTGKWLSGLGAAAVGGLLAKTKVFADMGDELAKASVRTGIAVENLSELKYAAEQSGSNLADLETSLRSMSRTLVDAAEGSDSAQQALRRVGLSVGQLSKMSPEEQFKAIADGLANIDNPTKKAAAAMDIFGKSGTQLLPLLADGAKGIQALQDRAKRLGITMSTADAKAAEAFGDALSDLAVQAKAVIFNVGAVVARTIMPFITAAIDAGAKVVAWVKQNRELVSTIFKVAAGAAAAGAGLVIVGAAIAAIANPIGAVIAALGVGAVGFFNFTEAGGEAASWLMEKFREMGAWMIEVFGAVSAAIAAGRWDVAFKVLWAAVQVAVQTGFNWLVDKWEGVKIRVVGLWNETWAAVLRIMGVVLHGISVAWIETVAALKKVWATFKKWHATATNEMADKFAKAWVSMTAESEAQAKQQRAYLEDMRKKEQGAIDAGAKEELNAAEKDRSNARLAESLANQAAMASVEKDLADAWAKARASRDDAVTQSQKQLDDAKRELADSIQEANGLKPLPSGGGPRRPDPKQFEGLGESLNLKAEQQAKMLESRGTFNAAAVAGLGQTSWQAKLVEGVGKMVKEVQGLRSDMQENAGVSVA